MFVDKIIEYSNGLYYRTISRTRVLLGTVQEEGESQGVDNGILAF